MKKGLLVVLGALLLAPVAFGNDWGLGLKLGGARNSPSDLNLIYDNTLAASKEKTEGPIYFGVEAMYEFTLNDEVNKLGIKAGADIYANNEVELKGITMTPGWDETTTEKTYAFPFTVYYKYDQGIEHWSFFGGAGVTILRSTIEQTGVADVNKTKIFPHIVIGTEYRFSQAFALGFEGRYNFNAKVEKDDGVLSDRSGFGAALTGRFYFN